ncbi:MFS transporter [Natronolimnohabitans sp. A-GB9]|uniref:MFS transporter n=1 Tax=Natronolimnohabitans sp. A-GB9 TaxID=3069757 RepID=UPI0027AF66B1|nr:MFS transporter [Natronolimnohabitans sp. A-GB9]MDQ2052528.1 MFS transporter [Natronolimnohabitans sp. A-GB9]
MDDSDRQIVLFTSAAHGLVHTYELSIPILMTVWLTEFSTTAATLGLIVTVGYGLFGVGALPAGVLVDQYGSKPLILMCLAGMAASFVLVGLSGSILILGAAIAFWGITASVYHPAGLALLSTRVKRTGTALGYHGIGGNLGIAIGPLVTALLLLWFDWRVVSILLAAPAIVVLVLGIFVKVAPKDVKTSATTDGGPEGANDTKGQVSLESFVADTHKLVTVTFGLVLFVVMMSGLYYRAFLTFLPDLLSDFLAGMVDIELVDPDSPYAEEFDLARYFYVTILIFGVFGQYLGGHLADRIPIERALVYVLVTLTILTILFGPATATMPGFVVISLLLGVVLFTIQPLQQAAVAKHTSPGTRGISFGYTFLVIFGIGAFGAALTGTVLTAAGVRELFLVLGAIAAIGAAIAFILHRVGH